MISQPQSARAEIPDRGQKLAVDVGIVGAELIEEFVVAMSGLGLGGDFDCAESFSEFAIGEKCFVELRAGDSELALRVILAVADSLNNSGA